MPRVDDKPGAGRPTDRNSLRSRLGRGEARNLSVIVPEERYRALRVQSALTDMNLSEILSLAIAEWLERHASE